jgi:hypothetical protein
LVPLTSSFSALAQTPSAMTEATLHATAATLERIDLLMCFNPFCFVLEAVDCGQSPKLFGSSCIALTSNTRQANWHSELCLNHHLQPFIPPDTGYAAISVIQLYFITKNNFSQAFRHFFRANSELLFALIFVYSAQYSSFRFCFTSAGVCPVRGVFRKQIQDFCAIRS